MPLSLRLLWSVRVWITGDDWVGSVGWHHVTFGFVDGLAVMADLEQLAELWWAGPGTPDWLGYRSNCSVASHLSRVSVSLEAGVGDRWGSVTGSFESTFPINGLLTGGYLPSPLAPKIRQFGPTPVGFRGGRLFLPGLGIEVLSSNGRGHLDTGWAGLIEQTWNGWLAAVAGYGYPVFLRRHRHFGPLPRFDVYPVLAFRFADLRIRTQRRRQTSVPEYGFPLTLP